MYLNELSLIFLLTLIAVCANFLSAFSGGGAGLVQLPALILLGLPFSKALATHKLASIALGIGASIRHFQEKDFSKLHTTLILGCGLPGVLIGSNIIFLIPNEVSTFALGLFTLLIGFFSSKRASNQKKQSPKNLNAIEILFGGFVIFIIGIINGSITSGTGLFVTLWLVNWFGFSYTKAIGYTLVLVGIFWNGTGALILVTNGEVQWNWLPTLIFGSLIGGYLGAHFSLIKSESVVKKAFEIIAISMGISLIAKAFL